jgi:hypothetical protein
MMLLFSSLGMAQQSIILPGDGTSSQFSAPQDGLRYQRIFYLITPDEMGLTDISNGGTIDELGFTLTEAPTKNNDASATLNFPGSNFESNSETSTTVSTLNYTGLPDGAEIITASLILTDFTAVSPSKRNELRYSLSGGYTLAEASVSNADSPGTVGTVNVALNNFPTTAANINLNLRETVDTTANDVDATLASARIELTYKIKGNIKVYLGNTSDTERTLATTWTTMSTTNTSETITIEPGPYEWRVKAIVGGVDSPYSDTLAFISSDPEDCNTPTNADVTNVGLNSATVTWSAPTSNGFTNYQVQFKEIGADNYTTFETITNAATKTSTITNLSSGTTYQWQVVQNCSDSDPVSIGGVFTTTDNGCGNVTLTGLSVSSATDESVELTWTAESDVSYEIDYRRTGTSTYTTVTSSSNSVTISGLDAGTTYDWRIRTSCVDDSNNTVVIRKGPYSSVSTFTTTGTAPLFAPDGLENNELSQTQVTFSWNPVTNATSYVLEYRIKESITWTDVQAEGLTLVYDDFFELPEETGPYSLPLSSQFSYTAGQGLYVAVEYTRADGDLAPKNRSLSTQTGILTEEDNNGDVTSKFFSFSTQTPTSATAQREVLPSSFFRPQTHIISNALTDIAEVATIYALGYHAISFSNPSPIAALIKNHDSSNQTFTVNVTITDVNGTQAASFSSSETVNAESEALVSFSNWVPSQAGTYTITVSIPTQSGEGVLVNNTNTYTQVVGPALLGYANDLSSFTSAGFDTGSGLILARHTLDGCGKINAADIFLDFSAVDESVYAVVLDKDGNILDQSASFTPSQFEVNDYHTFFFPNTPSITSGEDFYVGLAQTASADAYNPVGVQWETEDIRSTTYYRANIDGSGLVETKAPGRLMIKAEIIAEGVVPVIDGNLTLCSTNTSNTLTVVAESQRVANEVTAFTRGGVAIDIDQSGFNVGQLLGAPNVYPNFDNSEDNFLTNQNNFTNTEVIEVVTIELSGAASDIDYVDIYETYREGSEVTIAVEAVTGGGNVSIPLESSPTAGSSTSRIIRYKAASTVSSVTGLILTITSPDLGSKIGIDAIVAGTTGTASFNDYAWSQDGSTLMGETSASLTVTQTGTYTVITDSGTCAQIASVDVTGPVVPTINVNNTDSDLSAQGITVNVTMDMATFCEGASLTLISSEPTGNTWSNGATTESITLSDASESGLYTVTYNDGFCEATSTTFNVVINATPAVDIAGAAGICPNSSTTLDATINDGNNYSYEWSTGSVSSSINTNAAATYTVSVTDDNGCVGTDDITTFAASNPDAMINGDVGICAGSTTTLSASPTSAESSYLWSTNETTADISVSTAATISVTITDVNGCTGSASVNTVVNPLPTPQIVGDVSFCDGAPSNVVLSTLVSYSSYQWSTGSSASFINVVIDQNSTFSVTVTDANGCVGSDSIDSFSEGSVPVTPLPITGTTSGICGSTTLSYSVDPVADADYYVWNFPEGVVILSGQGTTNVTVDVSGSFDAGIIEVLAANDCGASPTVGFTFPVLQTNPDMPDTPTGPTVISAPGLPVTYTVPAVAGATSYNWTVPPGVGIISGQGTNTVTVAFASFFDMGDICVDAVNACGVSFCCSDNCLFVMSDFVVSPELSYLMTGKFEDNEVSDEQLLPVTTQQPKPLSLSAYPNPNRGQFTIEGQLNTQANLEIRVFSMLGKMVYNQNFGFREDTYLNQEISLQNFAAGTYLVYVINGDEQWNTKIVVIE